MVVATGCVEDLSETFGGPGANVIAINNGGDLLVQRGDEITRVDADGGRTVLVRIPGQVGAGAVQVLADDRTAAGFVTTLPWAPRDWSVIRAPVVWDAAGQPIDLRPWLDGGDRKDLSIRFLDYNGRGELLGSLAYGVGGPEEGIVRRTFVVHVPSRTVRYLPDVVGETGSGSLNDHGVIVGFGHESFRLTPAVDGSYSAAGYERLPLGANDLNNRGDIVGRVDTNRLAVLRAGTTEPVLLPASSLPYDPQMPEWGPRAMINDQGTVIVTRRYDPNQVTGLPERYTNYDAAPEPFPGLAGSTAAEVVQLNDKGVAIGFAVGADGVTRPFRWT